MGSYDYTTMQMPEDVGEQTRNCFRTIGRALDEAGFGLTEARSIFGTPPATLKAPRVAGLDAADAQAQFLERFKRLMP